MDLFNSLLYLKLIVMSAATRLPLVMRIVSVFVHDNGDEELYFVKGGRKAIIMPFIVII